MQNELSRGNELVSRGNELLNRGNVLLSRGNELWELCKSLERVSVKIIVR